MKSLKYPFLLVATIATLMANGQYVQPMNYDDYSISGRLNIGGGKTRLTAASAYLELGDPLYSRKGLLFPRGKKDSITSPARGLVIFDLPTSKLQVYNGTAWEELGTGATGSVAGGGTGGRLALFNSSSTLVNSQLYDDGSNVGIGASPHAVYKLYVNGHGYFNGNIAAYAGVHSGADYKVMVDASGIFRYVPDVANNNWGGMTGDMNTQADLITRFNLYQHKLISGAGYEYRKGNDSLGNLQTDVRSAGDGYFRKTTDQQPASSISDFVASVKGVFSAGDNITISPLGVIAATGSGSGAGIAGSKSVSISAGVAELAGDAAAPGANKKYGTNSSGVKGWVDDLVGSVDYSAKTLGITGTTGDKTAMLNAEALSTLRKTVQFDGNENTTVAGTYDAKGKENIFTNGARFTGGGTVQNIFIGGNHNAAFVDTSMTVITPANTVLYAADFGLLEYGTAAYNTRVLQRISAAIQSSGGNTTLVFSKGTYLIGQQYFANGGGKGYAYYPYDYLKFTNCKNITIEGNGATLKFADGLKIGSWNPSTGTAYNGGGGGFSDINYWSNIGTMISLVNSQNVTVRNLNMHGNIQGSALGGSWGSGYETGGIGVQAVGNISGLVVSNCHINYFTTDAIGLIGYVYHANDPAMPVLIENCDLSGGGRQGISHDGGNGLTVTNCVMSNIGWTQNTATGIYVRSGPGSGIDIEPEADNNNVQVMCLNTVLNHCTIKNNWGISVLITNNNRSKGVTINDCDIENNYAGALWLDGENVTMNGGKVTGTYVQGYPYDGGSLLGYNEPKRNRLYNVYFSQKPTDYVQPRNTASGNTLQSVFENKYALLDGCTFDLDSATINISGTEMNNVTLKSVSASTSYAVGLTKGIIQCSVGSGGISFGDRAEQYGKIFVNGTEIYAPVASFSKGLDFYNFGSSTSRNKIRFVSAAYSWGTTYTAIPGDVEIHSDVDAGGDVAARYLGAGVWETIWKVPGSGGGGTSYWTASGSNIANNNSGYVRINGGFGVERNPSNGGAGLVIQETSTHPYSAEFVNQNVTQSYRIAVDLDAGDDGKFAIINPGTIHTPFAILPNDNIGISTTNPTAKLDVNGTFRARGNTTFDGTVSIAGGSPAAGKVLTSDASGNATWQAPTSLAQTVTLTTTTATQQTPWTYTPTAAGHYRVEVIGNSHRTDAAGAYGAKKSRKFYYNGTTLIQNGSVTDIEADEYFTGLGAASFTIEVSSGAIVVHFTGESGATIQSTFTIILTKSN